LLGGNGGNGLQSSISGANLYYAGGGGGGSNTGGSGGSGGSGGGGRGCSNGNGTGMTAGTDGLGGGGGGCRDITVNVSGARGGSGIVIIRYKTDGSNGVNPTLTTGGTKTTVGEYTIHTFTASGTFTISQ
jgi:hypothetical protein